jgi:hypothetical protein
MTAQELTFLALALPCRKFSFAFPLIVSAPDVRELYLRRDVTSQRPDFGLLKERFGRER